MNIAIVDDDPLVRIGLRAILSTVEGWEVSAEAGDGQAAVRLATGTPAPDVILMDIRMPGVDGLQATQRITADPKLSGTKVIVLTTFEHDQYVFDALRYGASGFLLKDTKPADLLQAIRLVADGAALLSPTVTRRLVQEFVSSSPRPLKPHPNLGTLTEREREIVALVAEGMNNDEIAAQLVVSPATARTHVSRAMTKLGARDRAQLVVFAYQSGLAR